MDYRIEDILDMKKTGALLEGYSKATGLVSALLDLDGNVLSMFSRDRICIFFYRENPETARNCRISDIILAGKLSKGNKFNVYKYPNGLIDVAVLLIVQKKHVANLFTGQFLLEPPNYDYCSKQADKYGFDRNEYMKSLDLVPLAFETNEQSKTQDLLMQHQKLLKEVGRIAKIGGWEFDVETGEGSWTMQVYKIHDLNPDIKSTMEFDMDYYTPESKSAIENTIKEVIKTGKHHDLEPGLISTKRNRKWVRAIGYPEKKTGKFSN